MARNTITNYGTEGLQFESGPTAVVQNDFFTFGNLHLICAVLPHAKTTAPGPTGFAPDFSYGIVGNSIIGGRHGMLG